VKTLAKIDIGDGREAKIIEHDDGTTDWSPGFDVWLTADPDLEIATVPAGTLVAGEMRSGSSTVEVRDAEAAAESVVVAGGRFLALLPGERRFRDVFVVFRDDAGGIVLPTRGEELKREALDTDVACPACDGRDWDRAEWRVSGEDGGGRAEGVVCRACGHAPLGIGVARRRPAGESRLAEDRPLLSFEPHAAEIVEVAPFPVYVVDAGRPALTRTVSTGGRVITFSLATRLADAYVEVTSAGDRLEPGECARAQLFMYPGSAARSGRRYGGRTWGVGSVWPWTARRSRA
jgi:hypothetical protein